MYKIKIDINCSACIKKIEKEVEPLGKLVDYNFTKEYIIVDIEENQIMFLIVKLKKAGFEVEDYEYVTKNDSKMLNILILIALFVLIIIGRKFFPSIETTDTFDLIFIITFAFLSSFHCISMCGPIAIKQSQGNSELSYYIGRIISYSIIGLILGSIGSILSLNNNIIAMVTIFSSIFLILLGLSTIDIIKLPTFNIKVNNKNHSSLVLGLLNGVLPCAVLQIMWLYVITLASPFYGFITMFIIAIISSVAIFSFSKLASNLSFFRSKIFRYALAIYVVFIGFSMLSNAFNQITNAVPSSSEVSSEVSEEYVMTMDYEMNKAIPVNTNVRIYFDESEADGCNEKFVITFPDGQVMYVDTTEVDYIDVNIKESGEATVECWMGMRSGSFSVK